MQISKLADWHGAWTPSLTMISLVPLRVAAVDRCLLLATLAIFLGPTTSWAMPSAIPMVTDADCRVLVDRTARQIELSFFDPQRATQIAAELRKAASNGRFSPHRPRRRNSPRPYLNISAASIDTFTSTLPLSRSAPSRPNPAMTTRCKPLVASADLISASNGSNDSPATSAI